LCVPKKLVGALGQVVGAVELVELKIPRQPETRGIYLQKHPVGWDIDPPAETDSPLRVGFGGNLELKHPGSNGGSGGDGERSGDGEAGRQGGRGAEGGGESMGPSGGQGDGPGFGVGGRWGPGAGNGKG